MGEVKKPEPIAKPWESLSKAIGTPALKKPEVKEEILKKIEEEKVK